MRLLSSIAVLALTLPVVAQTPTPGDPIRITSTHFALQAATGTFVSQTNDSLTWVPAGMGIGQTTIAKYEIDAIDVNYGRAKEGHALTGAFVGGILGGLIGLRAGWVQNQIDCGTTPTGCQPKVSVAGAGLLGVAAGAGIGALVGLVFKSTTWTEADPRTLGPQPKRVGVVPLWNPSANRVGLAVRAGF